MLETTLELPQSYETTIALRSVAGELGREFSFFCAPIASIHEEHRHLLQDPSRLLSEVFELGESRSLRVAQLPDAIFTLITLELLGPAARRDAGSLLEIVSDPDWLTDRREADPSGVLFAEYLAFEEVVPFQLSEQKGHQLVKICMKSYEAAGELAKHSADVASLFPHGDVAAIAVGGAIAAIDSVGVVIGVAVSPITREVVGKIRRGLRRLFGSRKQQPADQTPRTEVPNADSTERPAEKETSATEDTERPSQTETPDANGTESPPTAETPEADAEWAARVAAELAHLTAAGKQKRLNELAQRFKIRIVGIDE
ncbi:hypothetical protein BOO86_12280 [Mycobacterium sp. CBMA 234]|uniref:hypothetical protein n=1 Tax=Mycolicibacterium sp. CBMA 234 TaxID=1918495 RepID=UPI0012DFAF80|nr:hypothetical protein [Mycolicibacterium sp. CBMA 234]MUL65246.1 hypothetical protein [Mycolicibacterium sp. CBMA 234]